MILEGVFAFLLCFYLKDLTRKVKVNMYKLRKVWYSQNRFSQPTIEKVTNIVNSGKSLQLLRLVNFGQC